jgi:hypothetical protein
MVHSGGGRFIRVEDRTVGYGRSRLVTVAGALEIYIVLMHLGTFPICKGDNIGSIRLGNVRRPEV